MSFRQHLRLGGLALTIATLVAFGCSDGDSAVGGEDQNVEAAKGPCSALIEDRSGEKRAAASIAGGDDAIAQLVFQHSTDSCPVSLRGLIDKLRAEGCGKEGIQADIVSERSVVFGRPDEGRAVLVPNCPGREPEDLLISPPASIGQTGALTEAAEIIARTKDGTFNFYALDGKKWQFFGDSRSMLKGPGPSSERKCASCHNSGGLVMKELADPWTNWDARINSGRVFGIDEMRANLAKNLGLDKPIEAFSGPMMSRSFNLEVTVRAGNEKWNQKRVDHLVKAGSAKELLRPLFCTQEINLAYGQGIHQNDDPAYASAIKKAGQTMRDDAGQAIMAWVHDPRTGIYTDTAGSPLVDAEQKPFTVNDKGVLLDPAGKAVTDRKAQMKPATDTPVPFVEVRQAAIDFEYIDVLLQRTLVSDNLVQAIENVDLGRPVFSETRCGLLEIVPNVALEPTATFAARLDEAMSKALAGKSGPAEAELAKNLASPADSKARREKFDAACSDRLSGKTGEPKDEVILDFLRMASQARNKLRKQPISEHAELLPFDNLAVSDNTRWDPATCKLLTK
jgi:hypothetical protein